MSETTPGGPLYLRGIQRRAQNQQQKNSGDQASEATKEEQRRKAERKIRAVGKQLQLNDITVQRACDCFGYFRDALKKMQTRRCLRSMSRAGSQRKFRCCCCGWYNGA